MSNPEPRGPWLITGASGFLGRHLLEALAAGPAPRDVIALVRDPDAWRAMEWTRGLHGVRTLAGSVTEPGAWAEHPDLAGLRGIVHLAALVRHGRDDAAELRATNVSGTLNMVRLAGRHRARIVFLSTSGTVGCFPRPGQSADEDAPYCDREVARWPYYRSKIEAERRARSLAAETGADLVIVRPPVLLGPGDHRLRSSGHVLRLLRGRVPFLIRGGMHFADVRDVAQALRHVMEAPRARPVYHLPGTICTIAEFYRQTAELAGLQPPRIILPFRPAWLLATAAKRLGVARVPDPSLVEMASRFWGLTSRYAAELGYRSRPGRETLAETIVWLRSHHPELATG